MAAAGVSWTIGREGRKEFGESLAGKQYPKPRMNISGLGADGKLQELAVTKGESDGIKTAISGAGLREGLEVVSGLKPAEKVVKGNFFSFLRPPRPGGGSR